MSDYRKARQEAERYYGDAAYRESLPWSEPPLNYGTCMVCTDCYFAHHYGATCVDGKWFAGESDSPCDREPLALLNRRDLADQTDAETGSGIDDFSWSVCEGCGSILGGSRFRLLMLAVTGEAV